ncbi:FMN-binding negative transcriptional regulator [Ramlibacter humi]|uniref:FMN-binding negative transcriptional regulator n=1 Tax=Ramlibacter humi TaxID=2530451 RepID=A0A4Z0CCU7_9BURK|nr:FMN-binding negative transcriptional regulator [Ramlibacter humi]TFZ08240.1 FMN-binding negative transcriptional regulator [Ramlibacter humi]
MYMPPQFKAKDAALAATLMREHPFASLVSCDEDGLPYITHLPLHLEERPEGLLLLGHVAKPNAHWRYLAERPRAVASFLGPHAYLSPKVYLDLQRVPTWNYVAVHCTVEATLIEDAEGKDKLLKKLIGDHEPPYAEQWRGLPEEFAQKMLTGIVAFELKVVDLQCKIKLNQHRPESHARMREACLAGGEQGQGLVAWMDRIGQGA